MKKFKLFMYAGLMLSSSIFAKENAQDVIKAMEKSADYHIANPYRYMNIQTWEMASYYDGLIELSRLSGEPKYWEEMIRMGNSAGWAPGFRKYHADDHAVGHAYLETYMADPSKKHRLQEFKNHFDSIIEDAKKFDPKSKATGGHCPVRSWDWCDALFMAPPTLARLYAITGDEKYLNYLHSEYLWAHDHLYSKEDSLFFRDKRFIGMESPNGKKVFWGRGNGWVYGGLVQVLENLPKETKERAFYEKLFVEMSKKILSAQQSDGLWRANLDDPKHYEGGETSASGFLTYGLAWGVNNGLLDKKTYEKPALKAWEGLLTRIHDSGKVGYVQPVGAAPDAFNKDSTQAYGIGVFLLAGSEIARMLGAEQTKTDKELLDQAQASYDKQQVRAYVHMEPRRKDDIAWENDKMAFRVYGPALKNSIENSGIDVWSKSVPYSVIDKWYDQDFANIRSYHKDNGEGLDAFKVADTVGLGGTGIYKDGKLYKSNVFDCAIISWTTPDKLRLNLYYIYEIDGKEYTERKTILLGVGDDYCQIDSVFMEGSIFETPWTWHSFFSKNKPAADLEVATGIYPQTKNAKVDINKDSKKIFVEDTLAGKSFDMELILDNKTELVDIKEIKSGEVIAIMKPNSKGKISYKMGYKWGK